MTTLIVKFIYPGAEKIETITLPIPTGKPEQHEATRKSIEGNFTAVFEKDKIPITVKVEVITG
jgi:hypothetical protein